MSTKRIFTVSLNENQEIQIPKEVLQSLKMEKEQSLQLVLSNDCFIVLKADTLKEYLEN